MYVSVYEHTALRERAILYACQTSVYVRVCVCM